MCACWNNHNRADGSIENVAVDAEGHSPFKDVKNFIFCMEVHRCCCAWRRDIFHNCIAAIHLCPMNPNAQLFSGDCLKQFDAVMVTDNSCTVFGCITHAFSPLLTEKSVMAALLSSPDQSAMERATFW